MSSSRFREMVSFAGMVTAQFDAAPLGGVVRPDHFAGRNRRRV